MHTILTYRFRCEHEAADAKHVEILDALLLLLHETHATLLLAIEIGTGFLFYSQMLDENPFVMSRNECRQVKQLHLES